jgi:DNA-directed RNA polymerase specialized sigma24 family protein
MQPPDEETLVERARRGDPGAFEALVVSYQSLAFRTAFVIAGDAADAEEAAQDAFVKAHRALGRFRSGQPFRPWLLTIVANEARNRRRTRADAPRWRCARRIPVHPARIPRWRRSHASDGSDC